MYTESFAGDIDEILSREYLPSTITLPKAQGRLDTYGFTKNQRSALESELLRIGKGMFCTAPDGKGKAVTVQIDAQRKIVLRTWWQAVNLYQTLTRNDWYAGLQGEKAKPRCKRYGQ